MSDKKFLFEAIDAQRAELCSMADQILILRSTRAKRYLPAAF